MNEAGEGEDDGNSYDSELEADLFGKADPKLNAELDRHYGDMNARQQERQEAEQAAKEAAKPVGAAKKSKQKLDPNDFQAKCQDLADAADISKYRAVEGVSYVKYDKFGFKIQEPTTSATEQTSSQIDSSSFTKKKAKGAPSFDPRQYLAPDGDDVGFEFIAASEEQLERAKEMLEKKSAFKGGRKDVDKDVADMTEEEKAIFDVLDHANVYNAEKVTIGVEEG